MSVLTVSRAGHSRSLACERCSRVAVALRCQKRQRYWLGLRDRYGALYAYGMAEYLNPAIESRYHDFRIGANPGLDFPQCKTPKLPYDNSDK